MGGGARLQSISDSTNKLVCWFTGAAPGPGNRGVRNSSQLKASLDLRACLRREEGGRGKGLHLRRIRGGHPAFQIKGNLGSCHPELKEQLQKTIWQEWAMNNPQKLELGICRDTFSDLEDEEDSSRELGSLRESITTSVVANGIRRTRRLTARTETWSKTWIHFKERSTQSAPTRKRIHTEGKPRNVLERQFSFQTPNWSPEPSILRTAC